LQPAGLGASSSTRGTCPSRLSTCSSSRNKRASRASSLSAASSAALLTRPNERFTLLALIHHRERSRVLDLVEPAVGAPVGGIEYGREPRQPRRFPAVDIAVAIAIELLEGLLSAVRRAHRVVR